MPFVSGSHINVLNKYKLLLQNRNRHDLTATELLSTPSNCVDKINTML